MFFSISKLNLKLLWSHPLPWFVLGVLTAMLGLLFMLFMQNYLTTVVPKFTDLRHAPGVSDAVIGPLLMWSGVIGCFVVPLFACRIVSEQKNNRVNLLYFNSRLAGYQIVLSNLLTIVSVIAAYLLIVALFPLSVSFSVALDWGKIASGLLGLALLFITMACLGQYIASYTSSAILAVFSTYVVIGLLLTLYMIGVSQSAPSQLFSYLSAFPHFFELLNGLVGVRAVNYFVLTIAWLLGLYTLRYRMSFV